jgi:N-methylhydantoinase A/oxoprolinase/acetone carboxylase beta subunit
MPPTDQPDAGLPEHQQPGVRVGVDVGGTNTDAVVMAGSSILGWAKTPTTADVTAGIMSSVREALARAEMSPSAVRAVMIGTTHFTNAVVERRHLEATAAIRLGLPATASVPPFADWPADLQAAIDGHGYLAHGGYEYDGRPIADLDQAELREIARQIKQQGATAVAICAVFSPIRSDLERQVAAIIQAELPGVHVSLSHEIGRLGILERENACILNACLSRLAERTIAAIGAAFSTLALDAPVYLSQNDGTLMSADFARRYPVLTFASGPTNSMRGAAYLSGLRDAVVLDVGGTTSDIGALVGGFPREASLAVQIGGVRTNFRMPDLLALGIGGGSHVRSGPAGGPPLVGPDSVGYQLAERAIVFGGADLTATDLAVATGLADLGDAARLSPEQRALAPAAIAEIQRRLAEAIDQVKTSAMDVPVVLVGGGSILVQDRLPGASTIVRPDHYAVANAIGAAIAQVSGEVDQVHSLEGTTRAAVFEQARQDAVGRAIAAGADPRTIETVDAEDVPLAYLPSSATRIRVKVVGNLANQPSLPLIQASDGAHDLPSPAAAGEGLGEGAS